jgi:hypothetical protein
MKALIKVEDYAGQSTSMRLNGLDPGMATPGPALLTFVQAVQAYFNGLLSEYYALVPSEAALSIAARDAGYQSSLHKALITCGFAVNDETRYRGIWIPAPDLANFELVSGVGYRMTQAAGATFLTALNTVSDTTHTFRQGVLEFREGRQAKPGEGGYLEMQDFNGRKCYMKVPDVSDVALLATFAATINAVGSGFSTAAISKAVVLSRAGGVVSGTPTEESGYDSVALRAKLRFSWPESGVLKYMTLNAPSLKSTSLETAAGSDATKRAVTQATGDAIATALTTLYGSGVRNLTFVDGVSDVINIGR